MNNEEKNIYLKIQNIKMKLLKENIKKTGQNKFAGYYYYELGDITPHILKFCEEENVFTSISFSKDYATLKIVNIDNPEEFVEYNSPMEELSLKGTNKIQALGGAETYSRRYLYMAAFDIIENDMFDAVISAEEKSKEAKVKSKDNESEKEKLKNEIRSFNEKAIEVMSTYDKKLSACSQEELKEILNKLKDEEK